MLHISMFFFIWRFSAVFGTNSHMICMCRIYQFRSLMIVFRGYGHFRVAFCSPSMSSERVPILWMIQQVPKTLSLLTCGLCLHKKISAKKCQIKKNMLIWKHSDPPPLRTNLKYTPSYYEDGNLKTFLRGGYINYFLRHFFLRGFGHSKTRFSASID